MELLPRRQQEVLQATVHHYVDTIEPVGSRTLVQRFGIKASSATVRSAMGALEQRACSPSPTPQQDGSHPQDIGTTSTACCGAGCRRPAPRA